MLVSTSNTVKMKIGSFDISNSKSKKLLGVKFDHKLSVDDHVSEQWKKVSRKIHALPRVISCMNISKRCILINAFFKSKFICCPFM